MRLVFVRHGHPNYEKDCLTELGQRHAQAAALRLKDEGIERIFASTCGRAYETAQALAEKVKLPVEKCEFMREIGWGPVGDVELEDDGHPWTTAEKMILRGENLMHQDWMEREPYACNQVVDYVKRIAVGIDAWLEELGFRREGLYYRQVKECPKVVAMFSHGGSGSAVWSHLLNLPFPFVCTNMRQDYTAITVLTLKEGEKGLVSPEIELFNDAAHIRGMKVEVVFDR